MEATEKKDGYKKITKMRLIMEVNNDKCHNFYYEVRFRVYTSATNYYKGNFVVWFDSEDLAVHYEEKARITKKDIRYYAEECAWTFLDNAPSRNVNADTMKPFYAECRRTIEDYNGQCRAA